MGFIRFNYDAGRAAVWLDTAAEDGWYFDFDDTDKNFRVWDNGEKHALGYEPDYVCRTLNEVCDLVRTFT